MAYWNQGGADFSNLTPALTPEQMGNNPEPEGFFESIPDALAAGSVNFGNAFWLGTVGTPAIAVDWVTSKLTGKETTQEQDIVFRDIIDPGIQYANSLGQQERTMAGSLTFGIGKVLTEFASGGAGAMAVSEFSSRATSEVLAGKSAFDANMLALNQAAFAYAGAALPGALGGSLLTKAASGSGINVATGITQRAVEKGILYSQDDARLADYKIFDPTEIVIDMVLGAAFGVLEPTRAGKKLDAPSDRAVDAALLVDRARFEDAQIHVRTPEIEVRIERGINEQVRAMTEGRPFTPERLPDAVTMPSRDGLFAKVGSRAYRENLRAWMGDSKAVDENGSPLVVYHGTAGDFDSFDTGRSGSAIDSGKLGEGLYFTQDPGWAEGYAKNAAKNGGNAKVLPVYLSLKNPLVFDDVGNLWAKLRKQSEEWGIREDPVLDEDRTPNPAWSKQFTKKAQQLGFDGVQLSSRFKQTEYVVFSKEQIKSAIGNSGRFDLGSGSLTDLVDATELDAKLENLPADEIAAALGIKPDPEYKAFQQEIAESRAFVDLELPMIEDVDPATVAEVRKTAQAIIDGRPPVSIVDTGTYVTASNEFGKVGAVVDGDAVRVNFAEVDDAARGQGHGKALYKALIEDSINKGRRVFSDRVIESDAVRVYEALMRDGYVIRDNSAGAIDGGGGAIYGKQDGPVFEVISAPKIEASGRVVDDAEVVAADDYVSRVKSIGDIMGCMLRLGA